MIARIWKGETPESKADQYFDFLKVTGIKDYHETKGNQGVLILRRIREERAEFFLLSFNDKFNLVFGFGELLILGAALAFALHIVNVNKFAPNVDALNLAIVQLSLTSLLGLIAIPIAREPFVMPPLAVWESVFFMGVVDVAFTLSVMIWVQQVVSGTRAALIYALEPMWAALFGMMLAGDKLSLPAWVGCGLILTGMIMGGVGKIHVSLHKHAQ